MGPPDYACFGPEFTTASVQLMVRFRKLLSESRLSAFPPQSWTFSPHKPNGSFWEISLSA